MTDYKTVFQLAQEKGYKLFFDWSEALESNPDHDEVYELNPQLTIAELTLIQKWLRDNYNTHICYMAYLPEVRKTYGKQHHHYVYNENWNPRIPSNGFASDDFNISFLECIEEALKLLP